MAGGLRDFPLLTAGGATIIADGVSYNGASAGYTQDPQESINYVSSHDNQTLWDIVCGDAERQLGHAHIAHLPAGHRGNGNHG